MRLFKIAIVALLGTILLSSCDHRPIYDPADMHYVRVYIDETIQNIHTGFYRESKSLPYVAPEKVKVILCDPSTGEMVATRFLQNEGEDERGRYFEGHIQCRPGRYLFMARSFGSENTLVSNDENYFDAFAFTNLLSLSMASNLPHKSSSDTLRVNSPDHLFVSTCEVNVPYSRYADTLRNGTQDYFVASSIIDSYYIQLRVKGIQYLSEVQALLAGLSGKARLHDGSRVPDPVEIVFDMTHADIEKDEAVIYATFNTFGLVQGKNYDKGLMLQLVVVTLDGKARATTIDIADVFKTRNAIDHKWLLLERMIVIPPPEGGGDGGFTPGVEEWTDVYTDIVI